MHPRRDAFAVSKRQLTAKQRKFIEVYAGNGTEAARLAGYAGNDATLSQVAAENLRKPLVVEAIKSREAKEIRPHLASRADRQAFWAQVMNDAAEQMAYRLKASELLGKSEADFTEKVKHEGGVVISVINPYPDKP